ncbi:MAG: hypothetical protein R3B45_00165 [Bdellovibrionota bacterium]
MSISFLNFRIKLNTYGSFFVLSILLISSFFASCRVTSKNEERGGLKAMHGLPEVYPAKYDFGAGKFIFYKADESHEGEPLRDARGEPIVSHEISFLGEYRVGGVITLFTSEGARLGELQRPDFISSGLFSNDPWPCGLVEKELVKKSITAPHYKDNKSIGDKKKCYIEANVKGDEMVAFSVIGLERNEGLKKWVNKNKPALPTPSEQSTFGQPLKRGEINYLMDVDPTLEAFERISTEFSQSTSANMGARNTCLKNARATPWQDIQAHYYCQLPLSGARTNFANRLVELRSSLLKLSALTKKLKTDTTLSSAERKSLQNKIGNIAASTKKAITDSKCGDPDDIKNTNIFCISFKEHLADLPFFKKEENSKAFAYIMYIRTGVMDFNIESQNEVINKFYKDVLKQERPRRVLDPYPSWLADQPRYNFIRQMQLDGLNSATP